MSKACFLAAAQGVNIQTRASYELYEGEQDDYLRDEIEI